MSLHSYLKSRTKTLNPYYYAGAMFLSRLAWDMTPEAWRSRKKLRDWKNRYVGEKAVIVCNGPSLLQADLTLLDGVFTFGLNKINLLFDKSDFRPSCIVSVNPYVIEQNRDFFNASNIPLFLDGVATAHVKSNSNAVFLHSTSMPHFARDCSMSIYQGYTVTFVALQLAFHMGFKQVALIGADHNFSTKGPANKTVESGKTDINHFDPNYFAGGVKWQLPDLVGSERSYLLARETYAAAGREIVNATEGGQLEIFNRMSLASFL